MLEITVTEHLLLHQKLSKAATGQFTALLHDLILSAKIIDRSVKKAGLLDVLGGTGEVNVQGERVQKLDDFANNVLLYRMERSGTVCAMASEEVPEAVHVSEKFIRGDYILLFDPLDGSSNIDVNINVGTIFSIHRRKSPASGPVSDADILQAGTEQVAAGYILYGSSTMLVYTTGQGVHGFTLDPSVGEFLLSHPDIRIPEQGTIYSTNESYTCYWDKHACDSLAYFKNPHGRLGHPYSLRYVGSLVADFHRTLLYGGIFMYPADCRDPKKPQGKLRLMYEASPLAFLVEQADGAASDGHRRILELVPDALHMRTPLFIGSPLDVAVVTEQYAKNTSK